MNDAEEKLIEKIVTSIICAAWIISAPGAVNAIRNLHYYNDTVTEYQTVDEAKKHLELETKVLGLEDAPITLSFCSKEDCESRIAYVICQDDKSKYEIFLGEGRNKLALDHELYHVYSRYNDKENFFSFVNEWNATSYAIKRKLER